MDHRSVYNFIIMIFFVCTILFTFIYGPSNRIFVVPAQQLTVNTARELEQLWRSTAIHGRIAVIFARDVKQNSRDNGFPEIDFLDAPLRQGIVRRVYYVVPDRDWSQTVEENMFGRERIVPLKTTDSGFIVLHDGGRIHYVPLSKYIPEGNEKAVIVIDPAAWAPHETLRIKTLLNSSLLPTDLLISINVRK